MNWQNAVSGGIGGAATGSAFGPYGAAIGGGMGLINGFLNDPNEEAGKSVDQGWDESKGYQTPYWQHGQDQYGRLNQATGDLLDPEKLQNKWASGYENSPAAKRDLEMNKNNGLEGASSMGLMGSSAAVSNIQQGAGDIVAKDRQAYLNDLMQKYQAGIGLGQDLYGQGATAGANLGGQAIQHGQDKAFLNYNQAKHNQNLIGNGVGFGLNAYNDNQNDFNSMTPGHQTTYKGVG